MNTYLFAQANPGDHVAVYGMRANPRSFSQAQIDRVTAAHVVLTTGARFSRRHGYGVAGTSGWIEPWSAEIDNLFKRMEIARELEDAARAAEKNLDRVAPSHIGMRFAVSAGCEHDARDVLAGLKLAGGLGPGHTARTRVASLLLDLVQGPIACDLLPGDDGAILEIVELLAPGARHG